MSDETTTEAPEQPKTLKVFTCYDPRHPMRSCYSLVEDAPDPRQKHRAWHLDEENGRKAQQLAIKARDEEIARLRSQIGEYRRAVESYEAEVAGVHGEVQRVETPTPAPVLEINRDGYTDEELDDDEGFEDDPSSTYVDDDLAFPTEQTRADATAAFTDDDNPYMTGTRP